MTSTSPLLISCSAWEEALIRRRAMQPLSCSAGIVRGRLGVISPMRHVTTPAAAALQAFGDHVEQGAPGEPSQDVLGCGVLESGVPTNEMQRVAPRLKEVQNRKFT